MVIFKIYEMNLHESLSKQEKSLPGDILLITAFISYSGCFTKPYRVALMDNNWMPNIANLGIPYTKV